MSLTDTEEKAEYEITADCVKCYRNYTGLVKDEAGQKSGRFKGKQAFHKLIRIDG